MKPIAFDGLFGWFSPGIGRRGVILCGTVGHEQHCAHRPWRTLGERVAATGCPTLRFDYPGEGDSEDRGAGRVAGWLDAIRRACRFMREEGCAEEIVLVGLRLGGTLAALVAAEGGIDRLVLLAPFPTGRAYLREMQLQARTIERQPDGTPMPNEPGVLSVGGFRIDADLMGDLSALDLTSDARPLAPRILLLGPGAAGLAPRCRAGGSAVETGPLPELGHLVSDALVARVDAATVARVADFVAEGMPPGSGDPRPARPRAASAGAHWSEEPVRFGAGLFGIACRPRIPARERPAVLFVNMGADVHSGYGRQTTNLARDLARLGIRSLRMDLAGVGDSPDRQDGGLPLYVLGAVDDVRAAVDWLAGPVVVVGTCNGAYLALHSLYRDHRIAAAVVVNLYCFDWELTHGAVRSGGRPIRSPMAYAGLLRQAGVWRRILRGQTPVRAIAAGLARRCLDQAVLRAKRGVRGGDGGWSVAGRVKDLRRRGARLLLIYSAGDLGLADLRAQLGGTPESAAAVLGEPVRVIPETDHSFGSAKAQAELRRSIYGLLDVAHDEAAALPGHASERRRGDAGHGRQSSEAAVAETRSEETVTLVG